MNNSCKSKLAHPCVRRSICAPWIVLLLLVLALPAALQAQFAYVTNNGSITITGYTGPGGAETIPDTINGLPVTSIGNSAFYQCWTLTSITIPNSVTSIGDDAFSYCTGLRSITIPNSATNIGAYGFCNCNGLTSVAIPNSVTSIGVDAFAECTSLTSVTIPTGITCIADCTFVECSSLTSVTIPDGVTNIGQGAFIRCWRLTSITIPDTLSSIGDSAFESSGLTGVTIPDSVTSIGNSAFFRCPLWNATIGNRVTSVGEDAFDGCWQLTNITLPYSVTNIGQRAFAYCGSLPAITVSALNSFYSSADGVLFDKGQTTLVEYPGGKAGSYTIPSSVTALGYAAFEGCWLLTSVTIPNSVTSIEDCAFCDCQHLTSAMIPNSVTSIGNHVFDNCQGLSSVTIPEGVTSIGSYAFYVCVDLTSVTIPNSVTSIGDWAFYWCDACTNVTIGNSVTNIGNCAFRQCWNLASVTIPSSVSSIGGFAFEECSSLTHITIPDSVGRIGYWAFGSCSKLTDVTIPNSVTNIESATFENCASLTRVIIGKSVTNIEDSAFSSCPKLSSVYFLGNAPGLCDPSAFAGDTDATLYYLPGTTGWGTTYGGRPTAPAPPPSIQTAPLTQSAEAGSKVDLGVDASSPLPLFYWWYRNATNLVSCSTNYELELTNVYFSQAGTYTVVVSNVLGAVTSGPAVLNVIAPVERRPVPGIKASGQTGDVLSLDCADFLSPAPNWATVGSVSLISTSQYYFDLTLPLPPQRYYRAWQTGAPGVRPSLDLHLVPAITLTGTIGHSVRLDYINQFGPTDAWVTLDTVTLTNTSQLYFDTSAPGQPQRLYRLVMP